MAVRKTFWLLNCAIIFLVIVPFLMMDGMFMDGVIYAAISKNMAAGQGSLWEPFYLQEGKGIFYEHPPLVFWIQSWFFRLLGDGIYTERIYTFLTAILTLVGIVKCWELFVLDKWRKDFSWLPVLLILTVPVFSWSYKNNMLENTMGIFTLFAVYFISFGLKKNRYAAIFFGSSLIIPAVLSKGVVGLFPMALPFIYWMVFKKYFFSKTIIQSLIVVCFPAMLFYLLWQLSPGAQENITSYLGQQLVPALNGNRVTTSNRFRIIGLLLVDILFPLLIVASCFIYSKVKRREIDWAQKKAGLFFLLIGLSASLPLMASLKQRKFYGVPALPYLVLGLSFLLLPYVQQWVAQLSERVLQRIKLLAGALLFIGVIFSLTSIGKFSRDKERLQDVITIADVIPENTIIGTTEGQCSNWGLQAALMRTGGITLDCHAVSPYLLLYHPEKDWRKKYPKVEEIELDLKVIRLFKIISEK